jgi:hypothetical protein
MATGCCCTVVADAVVDSDIVAVDVVVAVVG